MAAIDPFPAAKPLALDARGWGLLLTLSLLWGGAFFFAGAAVREVSPLTVALARVALAAAMLWLWLAATGRAPRLDRRALIAYAGMGLLNNAVPFSLFFWAQTVIPGGLAAIVNATTPLFAMVVAHLALADERMQPAKLLGAGLGLGGVATLLAPKLADGQEAAALGVLACLAAALAYGLAGVFGRRFRDLGIAPAQAACGQLTAAALWLAPAVLLWERPWLGPAPSLEAVGAIAMLAGLSTALAYLIYFRLIAEAGAVNAALVTLLIPPSAIALGALFLDERLTAAQVGGFGLIALGLLAIDGRLWGPIRRAWARPRGPGRRPVRSPHGRRAL